MAAYEEDEEEEEEEEEDGGIRKKEGGNVDGNEGGGKKEGGTEDEQGEEQMDTKIKEMVALRVARDLLRLRIRMKRLLHACVLHQFETLSNLYLQFMTVHATRYYTKVEQVGGWMGESDQWGRELKKWWATLDCLCDLADRDSGSTSTGNVGVRVERGGGGGQFGAGERRGGGEADVELSPHDAVRSCKRDLSEIPPST